MIFSLFNRLKKPKSEHLITLSTPFGIMQHTSFNLADPHFGYATDDNARALIVANLWRHQELKNGQRLLFSQLEERFLKILRFLQEKDGRFYCYLTFDLKKEQLGTGDWFGRAFFALCYMARRSDRFDKPALSIIWQSLPQILAEKKPFSLRTRAYLILAFDYFLEEYERALLKGRQILRKSEYQEIRKKLKTWGQELLAKYERHREKGWFWPEGQITYDNGKIIQSFFLLGKILKKEEYLKKGTEILDFYLQKTFRKGYFQAPGNVPTGREPWVFWKKGQPFPLFDEQPLEAYSLVSALVSAYLVSQKNHYLHKAYQVYNWFYGRNRLKFSLVDPTTGAVHDGLRKKDFNVNKGAESYLALNLAYFAIKNRLHL